ncbi:MAG TPA: His/Gly/Thr/Pro-type tRNA ligase C-terminal domain-containing protein, partial [Gemmatimonadaceae bacterium]
RYRRQDEAGTPFGITIDTESTKNNDVTIRFRDDMGQIRVGASQAADVIARHLAADIAVADSRRAAAA